VLLEKAYNRIGVSTPELEIFVDSDAVSADNQLMKTWWRKGQLVRHAEKLIAHFA
jgi:hypothetical protein